MKMINDLNLSEEEKEKQIEKRLKAGNMNIDANIFWGASSSEITPLISACLHGNIKIIKMILDAGADPNLRVSGYIPLDIACTNGGVNTIKTLLKAGANPNGTSNRYPEYKKLFDEYIADKKEYETVGNDFEHIDNDFEKLDDDEQAKDLEEYDMVPRYSFSRKKSKRSKKSKSKRSKRKSKLSFGSKGVLCNNCHDTYIAKGEGVCKECLRKKEERNLNHLKKAALKKVNKRCNNCKAHGLLCDGKKCYFRKRY